MYSADEMGGFVSEILDDLSASLEMLEGLIESVKNRSASISRLVTTCADHVPVVIQILNGLDYQSSSFTSTDERSLPQNPVPVNIIVLELELLSETLSSESLIKQGLVAVETAREYLNLYKSIILEWINLCGNHTMIAELENHREKHQKLSSTLRQDLNKLLPPVD